jgi:hypothetical protein
MGIFHPSGHKKTKPIQSQLHAPEPPKRMGKREKSLAAPPYQKDETEIFDFEWHSEWTRRWLSDRIPTGLL